MDDLPEFHGTIFPNTHLHFHEHEHAHFSEESQDVYHAEDCHTWNAENLFRHSHGHYHLCHDSFCKSSLRNHLTDSICLKDSS